MIRDNIAYSRSGISDVVVHGDEGLVEEDAQPLAMLEQSAQRLGLARTVRQAGQLRFGVHEQALDGGLQGSLRRVEGRRLALECASRVVMVQPLLVQPVDTRDPLDPAIAPGTEPGMADHAPEEVAPLVDPEMLHSTSLGICCGQDYVAESRSGCAGHEDPPFLRNIICVDYNAPRKAISPLFSFHGRTGPGSAASHSAIAFAFISRSISA